MIRQKFDNKKEGHQGVKLKSKVFLAGCTVMVSCYIKRMTTACLLMRKHLCDTLIVDDMTKSNSSIKI